LPAWQTGRIIEADEERCTRSAVAAFLPGTPGAGRWPKWSAWPPVSCCSRGCTTWPVPTPGRATANAHALQAVERALGLGIEPAANHWLAGSPVLTQVAVWCYRLYYIPLAGVLLWVLFLYPEQYRRVRVTLIVMAAVALLLFWLLPMSPPRLAMPGIVDVVAQHDVLTGASRDLSSGQNHFSAFPSLHVGWSALCAYGAWRAIRGTHPRMACWPGCSRS